MDERAPKLIDGFLLAEVIDYYVECDVLIGGMRLNLIEHRPLLFV